MGVIPKASKISVVDNSKQNALISVFGDTITAKRVASVAEQFGYGIGDGRAVTTVVGTGAVTIEDGNMLVLRSGATAGSSVVVEWVDPVLYIPGYEVQMNFTPVMSRPTGAGYTRGGIFDDNDGFFVEMDASSFKFVRRRDAVDIDINRADFNYDKLDGTGPSGIILDEADMNGNVFLIRYGFLGFAPISLSIQNEDGTIFPVHVFKYPNTSKVTHISNTYLPARFEAFNVDTAEDVFLKIGSFNISVVDGSSNQATNRNFGLGIQGTLAAGAYVRRPMIAFRNKVNFQGPLMPAPRVNRIGAILEYLYVLIDGQNKDILVELIIIPSDQEVGSAVFTDKAADSVLQYSTDAALDYGVYTGGDAKFSFGIGSSADGREFKENMAEFLFNLRPGEDAVFALSSTTTLSTEWIFTNLWRELF